MIVINFRRIFLTFMFILGAATLYMGYSSLAGSLFKEPSPVQRAAADLTPGRQPGMMPQEITNRPEASPALAKESFFVEYRLQRERARGQQIELLREIVNNPSTAPDTKKQVQEQLLGISRNLASEAKVENLLKARGYKDAVACLDQHGATVVVDCQGINPPEEARIVSLVARETGFGEQSIIIVPKS